MRFGRIGEVRSETHVEDAVKVRNSIRRTREARRLAHERKILPVKFLDAPPVLSFVEADRSIDLAVVEADVARVTRDCDLREQRTVPTELVQERLLRKIHRVIRTAHALNVSGVRIEHIFERDGWNLRRHLCHRPDSKAEDRKESEMFHGGLRLYMLPPTGRKSPCPAERSQRKQKQARRPFRHRKRCRLP